MDSFIGRLQDNALAELDAIGSNEARSKEHRDLADKMYAAILDGDVNLLSELLDAAKQTYPGVWKSLHWTRSLNYHSR